MAPSRGGNLGPAASLRPPPETALACFGVRSVSASLVRCICDDIRYLYGLKCHWFMSCLCWVQLCQSVCPSVCDGVKERAKCRTSFLLGYKVFSGILVDTEAPQERTLDGGAAKPLGIKVS